MSAAVLAVFLSSPAAKPVSGLQIRPAAKSEACLSIRQAQPPFKKPRPQKPAGRPGSHGRPQTRPSRPRFQKPALAAAASQAGQDWSLRITGYVCGSRYWACCYLPSSSIFRAIYNCARSLCCTDVLVLGFGGVNRWMFCTRVSPDKA